MADQASTASDYQPQDLLAGKAAQDVPRGASGATSEVSGDDYKPKDLLAEQASKGQGASQDPNAQFPWIERQILKLPASSFPVAALQESGSLLSRMVESGLIDAGVAAKWAGSKHHMAVLAKIAPHLESVAQKMKAHRESIPSVPGIGGTVGRVTGGIGTFMSAAPEFAAEEGATFGAKALASGKRIAAGGVLGAATMPEHQKLGAIAGTAGAGIGEAVPSALGAVTRQVKKVAPGALFGSIKEGMQGLANKLKGGMVDDNMEEPIYNSMSKMYEEVTGSKRIGTKDEALKDNDYLYRRPADSVNRLFDSARRLAKRSVKGYDSKPFFDEVDNQLNGVNQKIKTFGAKPELLEAREQLDLIKKGRARAKAGEDPSQWRLKNYDQAFDNRTKINQIYEQAISKREPNTVLTKMTHPLKAAIDKSMVTSAKGNPEIQQSFQKAIDSYKNEQIPYMKLEGKPSPFISRYKGPKEIDRFLAQSGVSPNTPVKLRNFVDLLPDQEARNKVTYHIFSKELSGESNPEAFIKKYSKLESKTKRSLFPEDVDDLNKLQKIYERAPIAFKQTDSKLGKMVRKGLGVAGIGEAISGKAGAGAVLASPLIAREATLAAAKIPSVQRKMISSILSDAGKAREPSRLLRTALPVTGATRIAGALAPQFDQTQEEQP